ncbi:MAG TPA: hypothetical protein VER12_19030 [Polyangiaceae bacterium]|nr:hypothetical protein [Polyangiaceae bacterium]
MSFVVRALLGVAVVACPSLAQAQNAPAAAAPAPAPVRVFMRNEGAPLTFSARAKSTPAQPTSCISPCDAHLLPGDYQLKLNGLAVEDTLTLRQPGTLHGEYHSRAGTRSGAWLALNIGGIIGGVFITVGVAGSSKNAFYVGGGVLAGSAAIFFITYRSDRASFSFTPDPPADVRGMPEPAPMSGPRHAGLERSSLGSTPRGVGFRIAF